MNARQLSLSAIASALLAAGSGTAFAQSSPEAQAPVETPAAPAIPAEPGVTPAPAMPQAYPAPVYPAPAYPGGPVYPAPYAGSTYPVPVYPAPAAPYPGGPVAGGVAPHGHGAVPYPPGGADPAAYDRARADWISECADRYRRDRRDGKGGLIGGLLGALIGGVAGNRIDDKGDRWAGTLIGAGVGGIAGAVIGTVANRSSRSKIENEALDWCEDYLASRSSASGYGYGQPHGYGPVMMVPVMVPKGRKCPEEVVEEIVEPAPVIRRTIPRPAPDKRVKLAPTKTKRIEYSKTQ